MSFRNLRRSFRVHALFNEEIVYLVEDRLETLMKSSEAYVLLKTKHVVLSLVCIGQTLHYFVPLDAAYVNCLVE